MNISVAGLPEARALEAQAAASRTLVPWDGDDNIMIVAHRLNSGEWLHMTFDGANLQALRRDLVARVLRALDGLPAESEAARFPDMATTNDDPDVARRHRRCKLRGTQTRSVCCRSQAAQRKSPTP